MLWNLRSWIFHANVIKFVLFLLLIFLVFICVLDHADKNLEIAGDAEGGNVLCTQSEQQMLFGSWGPGAGVSDQQHFPEGVTGSAAAL